MEKKNDKGFNIGLDCAWKGIREKTNNVSSVHDLMIEGKAVLSVLAKEC